MHIYDPLCEEGAIVGIRNSEGLCLLIQSLRKNEKHVSIKNMGKLEPTRCKKNQEVELEENRLSE